MAMVPYELEAPGAMVPNESLCRVEHLLLVTKQIKSKVTRQCDQSQVEVHEVGVENVIHMFEEKQFQQRIPHVVLGVVVNTRYSRRG